MHASLLTTAPIMVPSYDKFRKQRNKPFQKRFTEELICFTVCVNACVIGTEIREISISLSHELPVLK